MTARKRLPGVLVLLAAFGLFALSCGGTQQQNEEPKFYSSKEYEENKSAPPDPCMAAHGEPRECQSNEDCCKGFLCSIDPERSHIRRYCLEG